MPILLATYASCRRAVGAWRGDGYRQGTERQKPLGNHVFLLLASEIYGGTSHSFSACAGPT
ncbi:MAG TPA: hypothetical protein PKA37_14650, partial [Planctomycetota bacterium]|nr:hypothetical protein [Planctomycetota bacterium]